MQNSLEDFLEAPDGAGKVLAHARLLLRLTRLYQTIAPAHLAAASHLANYKSGIVVIHATNGAVATKLKQLAPTLPVIGLPSALFGNQQVDFNQWAWFFTVLRTLVIAIASFAAYRIIFVGGGQTT